MESGKGCRTRPVKAAIPPEYDVARSVDACGLDRWSEGLRQTCQAAELIGDSRRQLHCPTGSVRRQYFLHHVRWYEPDICQGKTI